MEVLIERACGLDVHKKSITACIVTPEGKIKTFRTHTVFQARLTSAHGLVSFQDITKVAVNANLPELEKATNIFAPHLLKPLIRSEVLTTTLVPNIDESQHERESNVQRLLLPIPS